MARPAEFDRDEVLEKAMNLFWETGYTATSVNALVDATQLKPGSLYGAFHSKRDLFLETIDVYAQRSLTRISNNFLKAESAIKGIEAFFSNLCLDLEADEIGKSCFLVNTILELSYENEEIRDKVTDYLDEIESYFLKAIIEAQQLGELDSSINPEDLATYLMTSIWGLRVLSSKRPSKEKYQAVIQNVLRVLHTPAH